MIVRPAAVKYNNCKKIFDYFATPYLAHLLLKAGQSRRDRPDEKGWAGKDKQYRLGETVNTGSWKQEDKLGFKMKYKEQVKNKCI